MIRFGAVATNALASRAGPAAISVLPATAVNALASAHCVRVRPSNCAGSCCSTCRSALCADVAVHTCSCSSSGGVSSTPSNCCRRPRGAGAGAREPLRRSAALPTAAAAPAGSDSPTSGAPAVCDPSAYQSLSLLILLHECTRRAYGRPLLEVDDLLTLPARMDSLPCCVLLLATGSAAPPSAAAAPGTAPAPAGPSSASEAAGHGAGQGAEHPPGPSCLNSSYSHHSSGSCSSRSGRNAGSSSDGGGGASGGSGSRSCGGPGGGASQVLLVQHLNRAAAEALQAGGAEGSCLHVEVEVAVEGADTDANLLRTMLTAGGPPQRGVARSLSLTPGSSGRAAGSAAGGGVDGGGCGSASAAGGRTIHCPEALLLPLMSPNGTSAGIAVLFERWEVRDAAGQVALEGRPLVPELPPGCQPGEEELAQLQQRVRAQADELRDLKSQQGLTNKDPRVVAAVAALQQLKAEAELQLRVQRAFGGEEGVLRRLLTTPADA